MPNTSNIRNFVIIAHIDHGKSTLADRLLELTGTVDKRVMKNQYLDQMELERERGITIKMAPVRMIYKMNHTEVRNSNIETANVQDFKLRAPISPSSEYILNLIDTPGHSDFSYEVSRALAAVEGAILLVDATRGIQAQTLANFQNAERAGLTIIGAVNKIDTLPPNLGTIVDDVAKLLCCSRSEVHRISGKTGDGVKKLLEDLVKKVPPPKKVGISSHSSEQIAAATGRAALVFDSFYDDHKGVVAHVRAFSGSFRKDDTVNLIARGTSFRIKEVGYFYPKLKPHGFLSEGEIGYIATGIKNPDILKIGDTVGDTTTIGDTILPGYQEPKPVVFVALYPNRESRYDDLKKALHRLRLNDASFSFEPDMSEVLGRGFRCGFLGRLHFEIIVERLRREFNLEVISSFPSVSYRVKSHGVWRDVEGPQDFPLDYELAEEPMVQVEIVTPRDFLGNIFKLQDIFHLRSLSTQSFGDYMLILGTMPLTGLISDFDDRLKSVSSGFASFSYKLAGYEKADLAKLEILVALTPVPGLTRVVRRDEAQREGRAMLLKLKDLLPKQQFAQALQAVVTGRVLARENIQALKKDVTGYLYGGDRSRKIKLWQKQARGKKRLKAAGRVEISPNIFRELLKR